MFFLSVFYRHNRDYTHLIFPSDWSRRRAFIENLCNVLKTQGSIWILWRQKRKKRVLFFFFFFLADLFPQKSFSTSFRDSLNLPFLYTSLWFRTQSDWSASVTLPRCGQFNAHRVPIRESLPLINEMMNIKLNTNYAVDRFPNERQGDEETANAKEAWLLIKIIIKTIVIASRYRKLRCWWIPENESQIQ